MQLKRSALVQCRRGAISPRTLRASLATFHLQSWQCTCRLIARGLRKERMQLVGRLCKRLSETRQVARKGSVFSARCNLSHTGEVGSARFSENNNYTVGREQKRRNKSTVEDLLEKNTLVSAFYAMAQSCEQLTRLWVRQT